MSRHHMPAQHLFSHKGHEYRTVLSALKMRVRHRRSAIKLLRGEDSMGLLEVSIFMGFLFIDFIFQRSFSFTKKWTGRYKDFLYVPTSTHTAIINIPHQSGAFVTTDESTPMHHNHPKPIVYAGVYSWCCTFYGFG